MDYAPWPDIGCGLAEARERTADRGAWREWREALDKLDTLAADGHEDGRNRDALALAIRALENRINADFGLLITSGRLSAYGQLGYPGATPQLIDKDVWPLLTRFKWEQSTAGDDQQAGLEYFEVRVFPTLLAPCRLDLLAGRSLAEAFKDFVLGDPEVAALATPALNCSPEFERVFVRGHCYVYGVEEWPAAFEGRYPVDTVHPDPKRRSIFSTCRQPDPIEVVIAADALIERYRALIGILRRGELEAQGLPPSAGSLETIPRPVWSHKEFSFNVEGDVFQENEKCEDPRHDRLKRRWIGVVLHRPGANTVPMQTSSADIGGQAVLVDLQDGESAISPPFTVADVLRVGTLSDALTRLVFSHPKVRRLFAMALSLPKHKQRSLEDDAGLVVLVSGHHEPLLPLRYLQKHDYDLGPVNLPPIDLEEDPACEKYFEDTRPPEIQSYCDAVHRRARTLFEMLQNREVLGLGHIAEGQLVPIAHSIWGHEDYYVYPPTGDIYEATPGTMTKIWTGVIFEPPGALQSVQTFHVKPIEHDGIRPATAEEQSASTRPTKAIARVETKTSSYKACVAWLVEIMRASPNKRTETKESLWKMAQERWPDSLSERSFLNARTEAIRITGANIWSAAGASRKSRREQSAR